MRESPCIYMNLVFPTGEENVDWHQPMHIAGLALGSVQDGAWR